MHVVAPSASIELSLDQFGERVDFQSAEDDTAIVQIEVCPFALRHDCGPFGAHSRFWELARASYLLRLSIGRGLAPLERHFFDTASFADLEPKLYRDLVALAAQTSPFSAQHLIDEGGREPALPRPLGNRHAPSTKLIKHTLSRSIGYGTFHIYTNLFLYSLVP